MELGPSDASISDFFEKVNLLETVRRFFFWGGERLKASKRGVFWEDEAENGSESGDFWLEIEFIGGF